MIIDAHQHYWNLDTGRYDWLTPDLAAIYRNFGPADLEPMLAAAGVDATIVVQAARTLDDTDSMLAQSDVHDFIAAVVGWLPLTDTAASERLLDETYLDHPKYRGVRHLNHDEADPDWLVRPDVIQSLRILESKGLVFDVVALYPLHLGHVPTLAAACPGLRIVIDHLAKPPIASGDLTAWKADLATSATHDNVVAKVSGLGTEVGADDWSATDLVECVGHAIDVFGPDRLMFGSDWPVAELASDYAQVFDETCSVLDQLGIDGDDRAAIMGGTAASVYNIGDVTS